MKNHAIKGFEEDDNGFGKEVIARQPEHIVLAAGRTAMTTELDGERPATNVTITGAERAGDSLPHLV